MRDELRALLVSYAFPPTGGAGVQRTLKLAKYLPAHGVRPTVLTARNPSVPLQDPSLAVPADLHILRARTLEPGYVMKDYAWKSQDTRAASPMRRLLGRAAVLGRQMLVPDPQVLWQPGAQMAVARRLFGRDPDEVVFVSAPPFSQFLLAPLARLARGTAVVLDYRDEWSTLRESYEMAAGRVLARVGEVLEPRLLRIAHAVTTATESFRRHLLDRYSFLQPERVFAIPNGYDRDDLPTSTTAPPTDRLVVTYAGTIFRLTSPTGLLGAIRKLHARQPELARLLRVRFIGRVVETEQARLDELAPLGVERIGYLPHQAMMDELAASHLLLCLLDDVPGAERVYPAKVFELMALGRPCLTLAPDGALTALVQKHQLGDRLPARDDEAIARYLESLLSAFRSGVLPTQPAPRGVERYDRRALAGEFAHVFRRAVAWAGSPRGRT